jgi:hypothetical protein
MSSTPHNLQWSLAAAATAIAGMALVLLQPQWWEGALYTVFQASILLWLRPKSAATDSTDLTDSLQEDIRSLRVQLDEQRELLSRVLPLWDEQIQQAQDQLNMPGAQVAAIATRDRINLIINAVRADMHRLCEIAGHEHNHRVQGDNWLSVFASTHTQTPSPTLATSSVRQESPRREHVF